jgi:hypothetical protein
LPSCFCPSIQTLSPNIFFFSNRKKKNHREKKMQRKKGAYLQNFVGSALLFKHFLLTSSSSQIEKKKTIEKKKMQRKKGAYLQNFVPPTHFWLLLLASYFCLFVSSAFSLASSLSQT